MQVIKIKEVLMKANFELHSKQTIIVASVSLFGKIGTDFDNKGS